jgi:hypothetical protein
MVVVVGAPDSGQGASPSGRDQGGIAGPPARPASRQPSLSKSVE